MQENSELTVGATPAETVEKEVLEITIPEGKDVVITVPENVEVQILHAADELRPAPTTTDNILTIGLVGILAVAAAIAVISKFLSSRKEAAAVSAPVVEEAVEPTYAPGSAGQLKLHNVEPKTAAMLMAIVADKLGKPINELRFISIKEVE